MTARGPAVLLLCAALWAAPSADPCTINFVSHGSFRVVSTPEGECVRFVDDLGASWEVTNPSASWTDGLAGTIFGELLAAGARICSQDVGDPLRVCGFTSEIPRDIVGTLDVLSPFETSCPGWHIRVSESPLFYRVINCAEFENDLCAIPNEGRPIEAKAFVDPGITSCIAPDATVVEFRFRGSPSR